MFPDVWFILLIVSTLTTYAVLDNSPCSITNRKFVGDIKCSRENETLSRRTRSETTCKFPEIPANTTYTTNVKNAQVGQSHEFININVACKQGYDVDGPTEIDCFRGRWWPSEQIPQCVPLCRLPHDPSVEYRCLVSGNVKGSRPCREFEFSGTDVDPKCREPIYYSPVDLSYMRCRDGNWNYVAKCLLDCGTRPPFGTQLIIDGEPATRGEVPWQAAIYRKQLQPYPYEQICGGSLIRNDIVLSAAHCFWNYEEGQQYPAENYAVAVGKINRAWNDPYDDAQKSIVKEIHLSEVYEARAGYEQGDLAVVITNTLFVYTAHIRPVCLDFDAKIQENQLKPGNMGKVAGWGLTSTIGINSSDTLNVIDLPFINITICKMDSPGSFQSYITYDKICAGYKEVGKVVCRGDSGGGLAFRAIDIRDTEKFFLRGVVSTAPRSNVYIDCNPSTYITFTQLLPHQQFIKKYWTPGGNKGTGNEFHSFAVRIKNVEAKRFERTGEYLIIDPQSNDQQENTIKIVSCVLPPYPADGSYTPDIRNARPGDVFINVTIVITCHEHFAIKGSNQFSCRNGQWWPSQQISKCVHVTDYHWVECKEEVVRDSRRQPTVALHPLSAAGHEIRGRRSLRITYRGDGIAFIFLSREQQIDKKRGLYYQIEIADVGASIFVSDAGVLNYLHRVTVDTGISYSQETRITITVNINSGTLGVRLGNETTPLLSSQDDRFDQMEYIGFNTRRNSKGFANFKYACK